MDILHTDTMNRLTDFRNSWSPKQNPEKPWLFHYNGTKFIPHSWKDLVAKARCVGAWLVKNGIKKGDCVAIRGGNNPFWLTIDMALQYIGGVSLIFPPGMTGAKIVSLIREKDIRFLFVDDPTTLTADPAFPQIEKLLEKFILGKENFEHLNLDKIFTFDRMVVGGKVHWRENMQMMEDLENSITEEEVYSLEAVPSGSEYHLRAVKYSELIDKTAQVNDFYTSKNVTDLVTLHHPFSIDQRIDGWYAPMVKRNMAQSIEEPAFKIGLEWKFAPTAIIGAWSSLSAMFEGVRAEQVAKGARAEKKFEKTLETADKRREALQSTGKVPFGTKIKYSFAQNGLYSKIRKEHGKNFKGILCCQGSPDVTAKHFFEDVGFEIWGGE